MMRAPAPEQIGYFGKLPACADFVKEVHDLAAVEVLDEWMASVMRQLPASARWKINYDAMAPVSFAFLGAARHHALAGHLVASHDLSGRRFPFLLMRSLDVPDPAAFVVGAPLACAALWDYSAMAADQLLASRDPSAMLHAIPAAQVPVDGVAAADALACFMETATIGALGGLLRQSGAPFDCARLILALGLVLQPVMHSRSADLNKSLVLPLPRDPAQRHRVAAFWLALTAPFLRQPAVDLAIFFTCIDDSPVLVLAACDAAAETLGAIIDPLAAAEQQIRFADTGWVDHQLRQDVDARTLASYLAGPQLTLNMARELFLQTFIGAAP
ncbi:type VI secretion system-associated protein TagF [Massilia sp. S19_KUP03_FR1]|uniref:type VI secretion system-associated protein TagF n=1 Tax=Massilia sp. S19_KUP03_FR1 TaxID=3025503 RepID=UPI002FCDA4BB